jgi:outer membrane protein TolC
MLRSVLVLMLLLTAAARAAAQQVPPMPPAPGAPVSGPIVQLSMDQAVTMALETNLGLKADRLNVDVASENVAAARAAFRPLLRSSFSRNTSDQVPQSFIEGNASVVTSGSTTVSSTLLQNLAWYGGGYSIAWSGNRNTTTADLSQFNPKLGSNLSLSFSQPLFRNFLIDNNRFTLQSAERTRRIADLTLEGRVAATRDAVQRAYLSLIAAIEGCLL